MKVNINSIMNSLRSALPAAMLFAPLAISTNVRAGTAEGSWGGDRIRATLHAGTSDLSMNGAYAFNAYTGADGHFFGADIKIARATGQAACYNSGNARLLGNIEVLEENIWLYDQSFNVNYSDEFTFMKTHEFVDVTLPLPIAGLVIPIGVDIRATVQGSIKVETKVEPTPGNADFPTVTAGITPRFKASVRNRLGVDAVIAGGGAEVDLTLLDLEAPISAGLKPKADPGTMVIIGHLALNDGGTDDPAESDTMVSIATYQATSFAPSQLDPSTVSELEYSRGFETRTDESQPVRPSKTVAANPTKQSTAKRKAGRAAAAETRVRRTIEAAMDVLEDDMQTLQFQAQTAANTTATTQHSFDFEQTFVAEWSAALNASALDGEVKVYGEFLGFEGDATLFNWDGYSESVTITSGSKEITFGNPNLTVIDPR